MLKVNINEIPAYIELARKSNNNILIVGNPGVGKSKVINSMASDDVKVTSFTGSSTYEETINGIPYRDSSGLDSSLQRYTEPGWLREMIEWSEEHPDGMNILFIDEFNTAEPQVLKTFLSVLTEHKVPTQEKALPSNTVIIAAMNPCNQNNGEELIRPLASRFMTLEITSTVESFREYYNAKVDGTEVVVKSIETNDSPKELTKEQVNGILDQVVPADWNSFNEGEYHEINPRSMSNYLEALKWVKDADKEASHLSMAFFGKAYQLMDTLEVKEEKRKERIKNKTEFPEKAELEAMSTEDLKAYAESLNDPSIKGGNKLMECKINCRMILAARGE